MEKEKPSQPTTDALKNINPLDYLSRTLPLLSPYEKAKILTTLTGYQLLKEAIDKAAEQE